MSHASIHSRDAFRPTAHRLVRIVPEGFVVDLKVRTELHGYILKTQLVRKHFKDRILICDAPDGLRASNGQLCEECQHPRCRPQLRIYLADASFIYILDLSATSAENLFALEDTATAAGQDLLDSRLRLRVIGHGHWGEVDFQTLPQTPRELPGETDSGSAGTQPEKG